MADKANRRRGAVQPQLTETPLTAADKANRRRGAVQPQIQVQICIVHLIRNSLDFAPWKDRKAVAAALKRVYQAKDTQAAQDALDAFADGA